MKKSKKKQSTPVVIKSDDDITDGMESLGNTPVKSKREAGLDVNVFAPLEHGEELHSVEAYPTTHPQDMYSSDHHMHMSTQNNEFGISPQMVNEAEAEESTRRSKHKQRRKKHGSSREGGGEEGKEKGHRSRRRKHKSKKENTQNDAPAEEDANVQVES